MIQMVSSHIYFFVFQNLSMCHTHIYILLALRQNPLNIIFRAVFEVSKTAETVFTGHVRPMAQTYPASWTCPALGPDMFRSRVSSLYKGVERPALEP